MSDTLQNESSAAPAARLGGELRARRQSLGWELPDLAQSLRIRQPYLEAIEGGRMSELPGSTYALGFVRAYASALGLQGEQVASRFRAESAVANIRPALSFPAPVPQRGVPAGALMLLGLVILGGAYGGWYYMSEHQHTPAETVPPIPDHLLPAAEKPAPSPQVASILPTASAPAPAPVVTPAPTPTPAAAPAQVAAPPAVVPRVSLEPAQPAPVASTATVPPATPAGVVPAAAVPGAAVAGGAPVPAGTRIVLKTNGDAWVTVKQAGGPAIYNKLMHAGDTWPVPADRAGLLLTTGNAGATELDVDGTSIPNLGGSGAVRRDLKLDADVLKSGPLPPISHGRQPKPAE